MHSLECGRGTVGQPQTIGEVAVPVLFCREAIPDVYPLNEKKGSFVFEIEGTQEAFKGYCFAFTIPGRSTINYAIHLSTEERLR